MNRHQTATRTVSFSAVFLTCVGVAFAQPVSTSSSSVEWMAANSTLIVRAVIDDISVHDPTDSFHRYQTVSVRVLETVKGKQSERLQFVHNGDFSSFRLSKLQQNKQELLLFLKCWMRSGKFERSIDGYAYARFPYVVESVAILTLQEVQFAGTMSGNLTKLPAAFFVSDRYKHC